MLIESQGHRYRDEKTGQRLDVWFTDSEGKPLRGSLAEKFDLIVGDVVQIRIDSMAQPASSVEDSYLRLHLLSQ